MLARAYGATVLIACNFSVIRGWRELECWLLVRRYAHMPQRRRKTHMFIFNANMSVRLTSYASMEPHELEYANHLCEVHLHRAWLFKTFALVATPYDLLSSHRRGYMYMCMMSEGPRTPVCM